MPKKSKTYRLNAALSLLGFSSRRKADEYIREGRVSVNGKTAEMGSQVDPYRDDIEVDGVPLERPTKQRAYYVLYKPPGVMTTLKDPEGRKTVVDFLPPEGPRVFPVGRLDYDAEGLILFTNDGDIANRLMHPRFGAKRTYLVKVKGQPSLETIAKLRRGLKLEDGFAKPLDVKFERTTKMNAWYKMVVGEGRNRLIKRMWLRLKHPVVKLIRIEYAGIKLGTLGPGQVRTLSYQEVDRLRGL